MRTKPPNPTDATVGFFKTGSPMTVLEFEAAGECPYSVANANAYGQPDIPRQPQPQRRQPTLSPSNITQIGGSIVPGSTDTGNHGDDQVTNVPLPFPYTLVGQTFNSINVSSNGNAQFNTSDTGFTNVCLPWSGHDYTIFPYWDDQRTDVVGGTGIFTSISGTAPNRIFNIEWRTSVFQRQRQRQLRVALV